MAFRSRWGNHVRRDYRETSASGSCRRLALWHFGSYAELRSASIFAMSPSGTSATTAYFQDAFEDALTYCLRLQPSASTLRTRGPTYEDW